MKATQRDFGTLARKAAAQARVFFFCGPDEAGASAAAQTIVRLLPDAGERIELSGADLRRDPVLLGDEARSTSLFGDTRHILVRASGDEAHAALELLLDGQGDPCPVLVVATAATDKSRSAKLLAGRPDALVAMFYPPEFADMKTLVRDLADAAGLRLSGDLTERIARASASDRRLAAAELEKLALYCDASPAAPREATPADWDAVGAKTEEDGLMPLVNAALSGRTNRLPAELARMREAALNPVGVALACERRAAQLAGLAARLGERRDLGGFLEEEKRARRIFFKDARDIGDQLRVWRGRRLERLVDRLTTLHRRLLADNRGAHTLLAQELTEIARGAAPRR